MTKAYEEKTINNTKYGIHLLPAMKAALIGQKLIKALVPVVGSYFDARTSDKLDGMKFSTLATILAENLDELELETLITEVVAKNLTVNGQAVDFDTHFQGHVGVMFDVLAWAAEVNFKSLFLESTLGKQVLETMKNIMPPTEETPSEEESKETEA